MVTLIAVLAFLAALALTGYIVTHRHPARAKHERAFAVAFAVLFVILIGVIVTAFFAGWRQW